MFIIVLLENSDNSILTVIWKCFQCEAKRHSREKTWLSCKISCIYLDIFIAHIALNQSQLRRQFYPEDLGNFAGSTINFLSPTFFLPCFAITDLIVSCVHACFFSTQPQHGLSVAYLLMNCAFIVAEVLLNTYNHHYTKVHFIFNICDSRSRPRSIFVFILRVMRSF